MSTQVNVQATPVEPNPFASATEGVDSSQQAVPVPIVHGTQKVAVVWASVVYNLNSQPSSGTSKK